MLCTSLLVSIFQANFTVLFMQTSRQSSCCKTHDGLLKLGVQAVWEKKGKLFKVNWPVLLTLHFSSFSCSPVGTCTKHALGGCICDVRQYCLTAQLSKAWLINGITLVHFIWCPIPLSAGSSSRSDNTQSE